MIDELRDALQNSFDVLRNYPAGFVGLFIMPLIIIGFCLMTNLVFNFANPGWSTLLAKTPICATPHYLLVDSLINPGEIVVKIQCIMANFNLLVLISYYFQLFAVLFVVIIILINVLNLS